MVLNPTLQKFFPIYPDKMYCSFKNTCFCTINMGCIILCPNDVETHRKECLYRRSGIVVFWFKSIYSEMLF
jgi:hypothetical protein